MRWWHQFLFRLERIVHWREADQDLEEEIRSHIDLEIQDNIDRGMPPEEAKRVARIKFGGVDLAKEDSRAVWGLLWAEQLWQDLRYGARVLMKSPGFTATVVVSLALGIGATTAVFSVLDTVFLRPLPYPETDRLVGIRERRLDMPEPEGWLGGVSTPTFLDWKKQSQSYEEMAEYTCSEPVFNGSEQTKQVYVQHVSEGYFQLLGARACRGRLFVPDDYAPDQPGQVILSCPAWQRLFGSSPSIIGSRIRLDGDPLQVIGVMSPECRPLGGGKVDFWVRHFVGKRDLRMWDVIGRLKPGISIENAQAEMDVIEARLARQYPEQKGYGARIQPLQLYLYGYWKILFLAFFGAVCLVLLIACMNVANLLLARGTAREKEMAVRSSLGAGRPRLVRQMLTESLLLSLLGTGLGLLLAHSGVRFAVYLSPEDAIPRADEISINLRMLGFTVLVVMLTAWLFGLVPAVRTSKPDLTESLKEGGHKLSAHLGGRRIQSVLVIGQIALSLLLLVGAGLMIHNVWRFLHKGVGFKTDHLAQISIRLPRSEYVQDSVDGSARMKPKAALTLKNIEERLRALPGVGAASVTGSGVLVGCEGGPVSTEGPPSRQAFGQIASCYEPVSPDYFGMLEIPMLEGRAFTDRDSSSAPPIAVINQNVARRFFPGQDPIGKMINIGNWATDDFERRQVVGVVADVRLFISGPVHAIVYYPYSQLPAKIPPIYERRNLAAAFLVRSEANPATLVRAMDRAVAEVARDVLISPAQTVNHTRWSQSQQSRFFTSLLAAFAGTALVLAMVGVFGVMSYEVARRTHEMGIRMALGAHSRNVIGLILRNGLIMTLIGLGIGLGSSLALARFLESRLGELEMTELKATDPPTLVAVCLVFAIVALLACYLPAHRAARMNPLTSLRHE